MGSEQIIIQYLSILKSVLLNSVAYSSDNMYKGAAEKVLLDTFLVDNSLSSSNLKQPRGREEFMSRQSLERVFSADM